MPADMTITVNGADRVLAMLAEVRGQLPYAQMTAVNRTATDMLMAARRQISATYTVRTPNFILPPMLLPREWRATKERPQARVTLGDGGQKKLGERRRAILEPFEEGKPKTISRYGPVAIPTSYLRPNRSNLIEPKLYPRHLVGVFSNKGDFLFTGKKARVSSRSNKRTGAVKGQAVGRYFVMGGEGDRFWGIYERQTKERLRKLWNYRSLVRRPGNLSFYDTMNRTFADRWQDNFAAAVSLALRTAK